MDELWSGAGGTAGEPPGQAPEARVLCLPANASSGAEWRPLATGLGPRWRVMVPGRHDRRRHAAVIGTDVPTLSDEVGRLGPALTGNPGGVHLVGHGYGGAVALRAAVQHPGHVRSLVLFEPLLFSLPLAQEGRSQALDAVEAMVRQGEAAVLRGDSDAAARRALDFWAGAGGFDALPAERRRRLGRAMRGLGVWWRVLSSDPTPLSVFAGIDVPVLCLAGQDSPPAAAAVTERLLSVLPNAQSVRFAGMGHLGPILQPERVIPVVRRFLQDRRAALDASATERSRETSAGDSSDAALIARWADRMAVCTPPPAAQARGRSPGRGAAALVPPSSDPQAAPHQPFRAPPI